MKKIFMASLVAMMAVTAANADIASTTYVDTYVDTRAGEMTIGQDGKLANAGYGTDQELKFVKNTDALNAAIGKLDAAIDTQKGNFDNKLDAYVKKADANETKKGGTAGTFVYSVEQVNGDVTAEQGAFLSEIASGTLTTEQEATHKVAPQAGAVKDYVDGKLALVTGEDGISGLQAQIDELGRDKADKATTLEGYGITDAYTKGEVDAGFTDEEEVKTLITNNAINSITEGGANGTIKVDNTDVPVHGLGTAAYTDSGAYATAAQGALADAALPAESLTKAAENNEDGVYTLTMKKQGETLTYYWEKIGR